MRPVGLFVVLLLAAATGGCAGTAAPPVAHAPSDLDSLVYGTFAVTPAATARAQAVPAAVPTPAAEPPYTLDTGDRLRVVVFGQDGLSNSYIVDAGGAITMPLIKSVAARGLTTNQLARVVADRLRQGFVREPHVAIEVETYRPFFILGEVLAPGQYAYVPRMTVRNAVAIAGGFTPRAYRSDISIERPAPVGVVRMSVPPVARVWPGDTVIVKERWF